MFYIILILLSLALSYPRYNHHNNSKEVYEESSQYHQQEYKIKNLSDAQVSDAILEIIITEHGIENVIVEQKESKVIVIYKSRYTDSKKIRKAIRNAGAKIID